MPSILILIVGGAFLFFGSLKVYPFTKTVEIAMTKDFTSFSTVFPAVYITGYKPDPIIYMKIVGITEVILGVAMILGSPAIHRLACLTAAVMMIGAFQTLACTEKYTQLPIPTTFFILLCIIYRRSQGGDDHIKSD